MEMEKMIELIDAVSKSDLTGFKYEEEGIKLHLSKKENTCYVTENLSAPVNAVTPSAAEIKKQQKEIRYRERLPKKHLSEMWWNPRW